MLTKASTVCLAVFMLVLATTCNGKSFKDFLARNFEDSDEESAPVARSQSFTDDELDQLETILREMTDNDRRGSKKRGGMGSGFGSGFDPSAFASGFGSGFDPSAFASSFGSGYGSQIQQALDTYGSGFGSKKRSMGSGFGSGDFDAIFGPGGIGSGYGSAAQQALATYGSGFGSKKRGYGSGSGSGHYGYGSGSSGYGSGYGSKKRGGMGSGFDMGFGSDFGSSFGSGGDIDTAWNTVSNYVYGSGSGSPGRRHNYNRRHRFDEKKKRSVQ